LAQLWSSEKELSRGSDSRVLVGPGLIIHLEDKKALVKLIENNSPAPSSSGLGVVLIK
jgi:hypothetical protein